MNEFETRGIKDFIKEYIQEELDFKSRLDELEEDIRELQEGQTSPEDEEDMPEEEDEEDPDLPEEEELEDNPQRQVHEEKLEQASQKPSGTRVTKEDMKKLQHAPARQKRPPIDKEFENNEELDDERWDEEQ